MIVDNSNLLRFKQGVAWALATNLWSDEETETTSDGPFHWGGDVLHPAWAGIMGFTLTYSESFCKAGSTTITTKSKYVKLPISYLPKAITLESSFLESNIEIVYDAYIHYDNVNNNVTLNLRIYGAPKIHKDIGDKWYFEITGNNWTPQEQWGSPINVVLGYEPDTTERYTYYNIHNVLTIPEYYGSYRSYRTYTNRENRKENKHLDRPYEAMEQSGTSYLHTLVYHFMSNMSWYNYGEGDTPNSPRPSARVVRRIEIPSDEITTVGFDTTILGENSGWIQMPKVTVPVVFAFGSSFYYTAMWSSTTGFYSDEIHSLKDFVEMRYVFSIRKLTT